MNERIRELAKQCWNERWEGQLHFDNEKFAEMIIDQCIEIIYNIENSPSGFIQPKNASVYEHALREHFGVKRK